MFSHYVEGFTSLVAVSCFENRCSILFVVIIVISVVGGMEIDLLHVFVDKVSGVTSFL